MMGCTDKSSRPFQAQSQHQSAGVFCIAIHHRSPTFREGEPAGNENGESGEEKGDGVARAVENFGNVIIAVAAVNVKSYQQGNVGIIAVPSRRMGGPFGLSSVRGRSMARLTQ